MTTILAKELQRLSSFVRARVAIIRLAARHECSCAGSSGDVVWVLSERQKEVVASEAPNHVSGTFAIRGIILPERQ